MLRSSCGVANTVDIGAGDVNDKSEKPISSIIFDGVERNAGSAVLGLSRTDIKFIV